MKQKKIGGIQTWIKEFIEKKSETDSFLKKIINKKYPRRNDKENTGYKNKFK